MTQAKVDLLHRLLARGLPLNVPAFIVIPAVRVYLDEELRYV